MGDLPCLYIFNVQCFRDCLSLSSVVDVMCSHAIFIHKTVVCPSADRVVHSGRKKDATATEFNRMNIHLKGYNKTRSSKWELERYLSICLQAQGHQDLPNAVREGKEHDSSPHFVLRMCCSLTDCCSSPAQRLLVPSPSELMS